MKLQPLNDRVLVKRLESEEKTAGFCQRSFLFLRK